MPRQARLDAPGTLHHVMIRGIGKSNIVDDRKDTQDFVSRMKGGAEQSQCRNLIECTVKEYGRIDTLINNAGIGMAVRFDEIQDIAIIEKIMRVNFLGSVYCTYYALPYLKKTCGRLVGISSQGGKFATPSASGYGVSKHAMAGFFDSLRIELADSGINGTTIYPGWVTTGISSRAIGADGKPVGKSTVHEKGAMAADVCARLILEAIAKRKREVVMTLLGKVGLWLKLIAPGVVEQVVQKNLSSIDRLVGK